MTKIQNNYFEMMAAVRNVLEANTAIWSSLAPFSAAANHFLNDVLPVMIELVKEQGNNSTGVTLNKKELRTALEKSLEIMAGQIGVYAITAGDVLKAAVYTPKRALSHSTDDGLVGKAARMAGIATSHIAVLAPFGVTPTSVAALNAQSAAFAAAIGTPRAAIVAKKKVGERLEDLRHQGMADLDAMDAIVPVWRSSEPDFYNSYSSARRIIRRGHRTRALTLKVRDGEGKPVAGAILKIDAAKMKRLTSPTGQVNVQHLAPGSYSATIGKEGFAEETLNVYVSAGTGTVLEVVLPYKN